jgi:hypothetical protein
MYLISSSLPTVFGGINTCLFGFIILMWGVFPRFLGYTIFLSGPAYIQCTAFDDLDKDRFDDTWKLGMAFAHIAIIFVSISSIAALALACATYSQLWKNVVSACFVVGAMCQVLTFVVLASDICEESEDCTLSFGAGISVGGITGSLIVAASTYMLSPPSHVRKVAASRLGEDRDQEHADDLVTEDDTHGAGSQPDDVEEKKEVSVHQEEGKG